MGRRRYRNLADRILSNTVKRGECWCWTRSVSEAGYGRITIRLKGERMPRGFWVHRVAWELFVGPIPAGMTVDHRIEEGICTDKSCWRPEHLRLLTLSQNSSVMNLTRKRRRELAKRIESPQRVQSLQRILL